MATDAELVARCLAGETNAFEEVIARYQALVCTIAYSGTGDFRQSRELAQETFIQAWKNLGNLRDAARLKSWLCGIAHNLVRNAHRRRAAERCLLSIDPEALHRSAVTPPQLESVMRQEEETLVRQALERLPETYRETLLLFYWEQQSISEVAAKLELTPDAVRQRLVRGRQRLREEVARKVEDVLRQARPRRAFTLAVLAALPAIVPQTAAAAVSLAAAKGSVTGKAALGVTLGGAVWGPLLGLLGAVYGTRMSLRNARSPRERAFLLRMIGWSLTYAFLFFGILWSGILFQGEFVNRIFSQERSAFAFILLVGGVYSLGLFILIGWGNRKIRQIQIEDGTWVPPEKTHPSLQPLTRGNAYGALGGGIFGSLCWLLLVAILVQDWSLVLLLVILGSLTIYFSAEYAYRNPLRYFRVAFCDTALCGAISIVIVWWRWEDWSGNELLQWNGIDRFSTHGMILLLLVLYSLIGLQMLFRDRSMRRQASADRRKTPPE